MARQTFRKDISVTVDHSNESEDSTSFRLVEIDIPDTIPASQESFNVTVETEVGAEGAANGVYIVCEIEGETVIDEIFEADLLSEEMPLSSGSDYNVPSRFLQDSDNFPDTMTGYVEGGVL